MRLIEALKNSKYTENGAEAYASTLNKVYDMFDLHHLLLYLNIL